MRVKSSTVGNWGGAILIGILPGLVLAGINSEILSVRSILKTLLSYAILFSIVFWAFFFLHHKNTAHASLSLVVFAVFFHSYGIIYKFLYTLDLFHLDHLILLSWFLPLSILIPWNMPARLTAKAAEIMKGISIIVGILAIYNLTMVVINNQKLVLNPQEGESQTSAALIELATPAVSGLRLPDIYYLVTDETSGLDAVENYWKLGELEDDKAHLKNEGFFIASESKCKKLDTLLEMSSRLNISEMNTGESSRRLFDLIAQNRVMAYLKQIGYTTIVIDQARSPEYYETKTKIAADYDLGYNWQGNLVLSTLSDQFFQLVAEKNMLLPLVTSDTIINQRVVMHRNEILDAYQTLNNLSSIQSPKFIYAHTMVAHRPFLFDQDGSYLDLNERLNWNNYYRSYIFQLRELEKLVRNIKSQYSEDDQPIIIIQADHGARVKPIPGFPEYMIEGFPEASKYSILNMMYLPGFDYSQLTVDMDPINTFPIIFNHYFDAQIPLIQRK